MIKFDKLFISLIIYLLCINIVTADYITYYFGNNMQFSKSLLTNKESYSILSYNDILIYLFNLIDQNKDLLLDFREMSIYQYYTEPGIKLSYGLFKQICKLLDQNNILHYPVGLDLNMFNSSYTLYKNELGSDIYKDFYQIMKLMNAM